MNRSKILKGTAVPGPAIVHKYKELGAFKGFRTAEDVNRQISALLLNKRYTQAQANGQFLYMQLGAFDVTNVIGTLSSVKQTLLKAGWKAVSFNIWQNELSVCLWDRSYPFETKSHMEGKELTLQS